MNFIDLFIFFILGQGDISDIYVEEFSSQTGFEHVGSCV